MKAKVVLTLFLYDEFYEGICTRGHCTKILPLGSLGSSAEYPNYS